ncbi:transcription initiation factor TFIID subunit 5-like [Drosophila miranda]|uniref:transcription initiation factor TFIID subunit 5-like n=1 Tax=Drosophila miranda TaxID=7229 RepID=UPI00143F9B07|nr:transcription initiation factor TFIID subunit 5-like [Drosophila miranda]
MAEPMNIDDDVTCATLSEDHCSVAFGTASGMVHIVAVNKDWLHMNMVRREKLFTAHQEPVLACAGDRQLLTSSADRMRLWCTRTGFCQKVFAHHGAMSVAFDPKGCYFASASNDNVARVWRVDPAEHFVSFFGHLARLEVCLFHPNGKYLATGSADATGRIWDCEKASELALISTIQACKNGIFLQSGFVGRDALIVIWTMSSRKVIELSPKAAEKKTALVKALETFTLNVEK